jgi:hypothetical protein
MSASAETQVAQRQILLVGPYGVLGTGVVDAVAENRQWGITTAARRPVPTYRAQAAPPHVSVDLMDREGTTRAFSSLDKVTDLVFAAYVEKPTMAETVEPNAAIQHQCEGNALHGTKGLTATEGWRLNNVQNPLAVENLGAEHGRGIHLMKLAMDEVSFERAGTEVHIWKESTISREHTTPQFASRHGCNESSILRNPKTIVRCYLDL